jgi:photosystem II stability/assembly factor-like uncharacterized protein
MFSQWTGGTISAWTQMDAFKNDHILSIAVASNDYIFIGTKDNGLWRSTDDGASWTWTDAGKLGAEGTVCSFFVTSVSGVWAAVASGGVFLSGDGGSTWEPRNSELTTIISGYNHYINCLGNNFASTTQPFLISGITSSESLMKRFLKGI